VTFHQPPEHFEEVWRFRNKRARLRAIDHVVVTSTPQLDYFREFVDERVTLVTLGANRWAFKPPRVERPARHEVRCLAVGSHLRDPRLLREAIERATAWNDNLSFTVVSSREFLAELDSPPRTTLLHDVPDDALMAAYHDADLFVHPVAQAAGNTALLEAMSCGLPAVVSDVGGVRDYVDEDCAEIVPPADARAMGDAIVRLAGDHGRRIAMGASAERRSAGRDWPHVADELVAVYAKALARRR
jgi:glycosyltransferase involved in cell wall biosynthesis